MAQSDLGEVNHKLDLSISISKSNTVCQEVGMKRMNCLLSLPISLFLSLTLPFLQIIACFTFTSKNPLCCSVLPHVFFDSVLVLPFFFLCIFINFLAAAHSKPAPSCNVLLFVYIEVMQPPPAPPPLNDLPLLHMNLFVFVVCRAEVVLFFPLSS